MPSAALCDLGTPGCTVKHPASSEPVEADPRCWPRPWATDSSCPAWAFVAWLWDRREQYRPSSGTYAAFDELIGAAAAGAHVEAWKHGELDDLRATAESVVAKRPAATRAAPYFATTCPRCKAAKRAQTDCRTCGYLSPEESRGEALAAPFTRPAKGGE